jgi:outer membrane protein assembly factor BamA
MRHRGWIGILMMAAVGLAAQAGRVVATPDSTAALPAKLPARSGWETAAGIPGLVALAPLYVVTKGVEGLVGLADRSQFAQRAMDFLVADDGSRALLPTYAARTGGGARYVHRNLVAPGSRLALTAAAGRRDRRYLEASVDRVQLGSTHVLGRLGVRHRFLSDEPFFGVGQDAREADESNFALEQTSGEIGVSIRPRTRLLVDASVRYDHDDVAPGRDPKSPSTTVTAPALAGVTARPNLVRLRLGVERDGRDHPGRPTGGTTFECAASWVDATRDDAFGFVRFEADASRYVHLFHGRTLRVRAAASVAEPLRARDIPFYELAELGGRESLRGFERGRFRDQGALLGSLEYRYPIHPGAVDAVVFADAGRVFADLGRDDVERAVHADAGIGLRAWGGRGVLMALDVGFSREGAQVQFAFNP